MQVSFVVSRSLGMPIVTRCRKIMVNQCDSEGAKSAKEAASDFADGEKEREIGRRLAAAVKNAGGNKAVSAKSGVPLRTLDRLLAGQEPKVSHLVQLSDACGVSLDWLATGREAPNASTVGVEARLKEIMATLEDEEAPISADRLQTRPDLAALREELFALSARDDIADSERGFADLLLRLVFNDAAAAERQRQREGRIFARLRNSATVFKMAGEVVGWEPPPAFGQALRTIFFNYDVLLEDAVSLLDALKTDLEKK